MNTTSTWPPGLLAFATRTGKAWAAEHRRRPGGSADSYFRRRLASCNDPLFAMLRPEIEHAFVAALAALDQGSGGNG